MTNSADILNDQGLFARQLFPVMQRLTPAAGCMEPYEFRYGLNNLVPPGGWSTVALEEMGAIERRVNDIAFYRSIQIKSRIGDSIVLDEKIVLLTRMLLVGLAAGVYPVEWVDRHFYFDLRGFYFLHRTTYFTPPVLDHFGGVPYRCFPQHQLGFETLQQVGYQAFKAANLELDTLFIACVQKIIAARGTPLLLAIAGPTAAGKTEIVERLMEQLSADGQKVTSIEMDNFLTDRDYREAQGIHTQGKAALHFELLKSSLNDICAGKKISIPRYDFIDATSSHDLQGQLKPGGQPIEIEPADVIFIEGNYPFLLEEIVHLIDLKIVYLTDDPVRLKRKWWRDIDVRKKYEPTYFRNRFFKDQFIMAEIAYRPQLEVCDLCVDTTGAALWATPAISALLEQGS